MSQKSKYSVKKRYEKKLSIENLESRQMLSALPLTATDSEVAAATAQAVLDTTSQVIIESPESVQCVLQQTDNEVSASSSNTTMATACDLGTISSEQTFALDHSGSESTENWFKFTLPTTGNSASAITLTYTHSATCDLDVYLYDANGNLVKSSMESTGTESISLDGKEAGTYYLKVVNYKSSTNSLPYTLKITNTESSANTSVTTSSPESAANTSNTEDSIAASSSKSKVKTSITRVSLSTSSPREGGTITATPYPYGATCKYKWYYGTSASSCTKSCGSKATLKLTSKLAGMYVKCVVTGTKNYTGTASTSAVKVAVTSLKGFKITLGSTSIYDAAHNYGLVNLMGLKSIKFTSNTKAKLVHEGGGTISSISYTFTSNSTGGGTLTLTYIHKPKRGVKTSNRFVVELPSIGNTSGTLTGKFYKSSIYFGIRSCKYTMSK